MANNFLDAKGLSVYDGLLKQVTAGSFRLDNGKVILQSVSGEDLAEITLPKTEISVATDGRDGLLSAAQHKKLTGISPRATRVEANSENGKITIDGAGVNVYQHPTHTAHGAGLYKLSIDANGHVTTAARVQKADITALGLPAQDTTYGLATGAKNGLMSSSDCGKLALIEHRANQNKVESISVNGTTLPINSRRVNIDLSSYAKKSDISAGIRYMGSVATFDRLPKSPARGDMYNVEAADRAHGVTAGDNVVYSGKSWDVLSGAVVIEPIANDTIQAIFKN